MCIGCRQTCVWFVAYKRIEDGRKFDFIEEADKMAEMNSVEEIFLLFLF